MKFVKSFLYSIFRHQNNKPNLTQWSHKSFSMTKSNAKFGLNSSLRFIFCSWAIIFVLTNSYSQKGHTMQYKEWIVDDCSIIVSPNTIMPSTLLVKNHLDSIIVCSLQNNNIILPSDQCASLKGQKLMIEFRTFEFNVETVFKLIDTTQTPSEKRPLSIGYQYDTERPNQNKIIEADGLAYRGSFTRGINVGNNQNFAVNSNFDMQLTGDLGNGLKITAAITDESLPIQAEGNTQQLQEFDKVFIQVSKGSTSLTAGDYILYRPESYFMNYFKKVKGLNVSTGYQATKKVKATTNASFAISNGKFARQNLVTSEGNQGPYRLVGPNGERFIIVLAGTEKVYFNGKLLKRGYDFDYVIDYNRAEVTFTPTRVVARDSRVIVEFEYTDISYLRSLYAADATFAGKKWQAGLHFYNEQDSKNGTGDLQLDSTDISILTTGGEDPLRLTRPGLRSIIPSQRDNSNLILYATSVDPMDPTVTFLRFTTNLDSAQYTAIFSEVGLGKGDYTIDPSLAKNGRVYKYVGKGLGPYLPITQLIPPEKKQLISIHGKYQISKSSDVYSEISLSTQDRNRLSQVGNEDNEGLASLIRGNKRFTLDSAALWTLDVSASHEYVAKSFNALNPYRAPEFIRDWNLSPLLERGTENWLKGNMVLSRSNTFSFDLTQDVFDRHNIYSGSRQSAKVSIQQPRWNIYSTTNLLNSTTLPTNSKSSFLRPNINANYFLTKSKDWTIGAEYDAESNIDRNANDLIIKDKSYQYNYYKAYIKNDISETFGLTLAASKRDDNIAQNGNLLKTSKATEYEFGGRWTPSAKSDLVWNLIARDLQVIEPTLLPNDVSKKSILGKLDYNWSAFSNALKSTTSYNTNAGQEPKVEYIFQRVEVGQGDYFLINESENPNLTNVQDFRYDPSNPLSKYIRLSLVNNEFIRTNNIELNQNLQLDASRFFKQIDTIPKSLANRFFSKFSTLSNVKIIKKQLATSDNGYASYIDFSLQDTTIASFNSANVHTLFYNRGGSKYDIQLGHKANLSRVTQINGIEDRGLSTDFLRLRWNIITPLDFFVNLESGTKTYASALFADRNLNINIRSLKPELNYRPSATTRMIIRYNYSDRQQTILGLEKATFHDFGAEYSIRKTQKYSLDFRVNYVDIAFNGAPNSFIEYDMLESLKNGKNFLWGTQFSRRIAKNLDLTLIYDGRKTGITPMIHQGRANIKATF